MYWNIECAIYSEPRKTSSLITPQTLTKNFPTHRWKSRFPLGLYGIETQIFAVPKITIKSIIFQAHSTGKVFLATLFAKHTCEQGIYQSTSDKQSHRYTIYLYDKHTLFLVCMRNKNKWWWLFCSRTTNEHKWINKQTQRSVLGGWLDERIFWAYRENLTALNPPYRELFGADVVCFVGSSRRDANICLWVRRPNSQILTGILLPCCA